MSTSSSSSSSNETQTTTPTTITTGSNDNQDEKKVQDDVIDETQYSKVTEGLATILLPKDAKVGTFYNEVQIKNRDLSILVLNEYANQLKIEAIDQFRKRKRKEPYRNLAPTFQTWGSTTQPLESEQDRETEKKLEFQGLKIFEALSASGLRSIRMAKEITEGVGLDHILINDIEDHAVEAIKRNLQFNGFDKNDTEKFVAHKGDAIDVMYRNRVIGKNSQSATRIHDFGNVCNNTQNSNNKNIREVKGRPFDVIDLDPYGSPAPFIDGAVQSIAHGGLLCVTATDLAALCGNSQTACYQRYDAIPLRTCNFKHELAVRIILGMLSRNCTRYGRFIVPLLSVQMDFYLRVFVRVYDGRNESMKSCTKMGYVYHSRSCDAFYIQPMADARSGKDSSNFVLKSPQHKIPEKCPETGDNLTMGGPCWIDPIHNTEFVKALKESFGTPYPNGFDPNTLGGAKLVQSTILNCYDELVDAPFFYDLPSVCKSFSCTSPKDELVHSAIINAGYKVSKSHISAGAIKTNAPTKVFYDIMRAYVKTQPPVRNRKDSHATREKLLSVEPELKDVDFTVLPHVRASFSKSRPGRCAIARYPENPKKNWGPKARAAGSSKGQTHKKRKLN